MVSSKDPNKRAAEKRTPEKHFRGIIESTGGIPWVVDLNTFQFTYVGPQAEKILGYPLEQWYETDFWPEHIHPDDKQAALDFCVLESQKNKDFNFEYRMIHRDGHNVWIQDYVNVVIEDGKPVHLQGFMFDVSKNKKTEQTLKEHDSLLDAIYLASPDMIFIHAKDGRILDVNEKTTQRYGFTLDEMRSKTIADISADTNPLDQAVAHVQDALAGLEPEFEWLAKDSDDVPFPVEVRLRKLTDSDDPNAPAVIAIVRDISERKRIEKSINHIAAGVAGQSGVNFYQQMVKHLAKLFNADYAFIGLLDDDNPKLVNTLAVFAHGAAADNMSYSLTHTPCDEVVGESTCCHPRDVQQHYPKDTLLIDMGVDSYIGSPLFDKKNNPIGLIVVLDSNPMQDNPQLTEILEIFAARASAELERDKIHERLENTQQKLELHVQQTPLGVIEWDINFCVTDWNPAAEKIFGYNKQETLGVNARELIIPEEYHPHVDGIWQALLEQQGGTRSTNGNITKDGSLITCEWYNTPLITDNGQVIGVASLVSDITERMNNEAELKAHREHLEELVEQRTTELTNLNQELEAFSYSVSHDLQAPLRHIDGFSLMLQEDYVDQLGEDGKHLLDRIRSGSQHMGQLINDLLKLSQVSRGNVERETVDISSMAEDIIHRLSNDDPERNVDIEIQPEMTLLADKHLVHVILENLLNNAWKYTSKTDNAKITFETSNNENGKAIFCVRDNGAGFEMKYANDLFTAFKRLHTNEEFKGTGIGLATVKRIINRHSGNIWVEAEANKGAAFFFSLGN